MRETALWDGRLRRTAGQIVGHRRKLPQSDLGELRVHCSSQAHHGVRGKVFLRVPEIQMLERFARYPLTFAPSWVTPSATGRVARQVNPRGTVPALKQRLVGISLALLSDFNFELSPLTAIISSDDIDPMR